MWILNASQLVHCQCIYPINTNRVLNYHYNSLGCGMTFDSFMYLCLHLGECVLQYDPVTGRYRDPLTQPAE